MCQTMLKAMCAIDFRHTVKTELIRFSSWRKLQQSLCKIKMFPTKEIEIEMLWILS